MGLLGLLRVLGMVLGMGPGPLLLCRKIGGGLKSREPEALTGVLGNPKKKF